MYDLSINLLGCCSCAWRTEKKVNGKRVSIPSKPLFQLGWRKVKRRRNVQRRKVRAYDMLNTFFWKYESKNLSEAHRVGP
jgi:hypothetical protein